MKIFTSYFGNVKKLSSAGIKMISISLYKPKFFYGIEAKNVAPRSSMIFGDLSHEQYEERYRKEVLGNVDAVEFIKMIEKMSQGSDIALCCYEKPGDFCHRHILAEWLKEQTGIIIKEFGVEPEKDNKAKAQQLSLF